MFTLIAHVKYWHYRIQDFLHFQILHELVAILTRILLLFSSNKKIIVTKLKKKRKKGAFYIYKLKHWFKYDKCDI